jgi:hypothetical protein
MSRSNNRVWCAILDTSQLCSMMDPIIVPPCGKVTQPEGAVCTAYPMESIFRVQPLVLRIKPRALSLSHIPSPRVQPLNHPTATTLSKEPQKEDSGPWCLPQTTVNVKLAGGSIRCFVSQRNQGPSHKMSYTKFRVVNSLDVTILCGVFFFFPPFQKCLSLEQEG